MSRSDTTTQTGEPTLPPCLAETVDKSVDDVVKELNRLPFFMTELDDSDGKGGENVELEALKSLAYEGEPHEIATNFKNQGNDCYKSKQFKNAVGFYTKGLEVSCDDDQINIALRLNRAACNLELKNYRSCIEDCKSALVVDNKNVKACFRSGKALFMVKRYSEATEILDYGLSLDTANVEMSSLKKKVDMAIEESIKAQERKSAAARYKKKVQDTLDESVKLRRYTIIKTEIPAEGLQDAKLKLEDENDYQSQLIFPAMVIYPTIDEFDLIAEVSELSNPTELLQILLDRPEEWFQDPRHEEFSVKKLECYMETIAGGLVKAGKKVTFNSVLSAPQPVVPLFDNSLRIYVVPKSQLGNWLSTWNKKAALAKREV